MSARLVCEKPMTGPFGNGRNRTGTCSSQQIRISLHSASTWGFRLTKVVHLEQCDFPYLVIENLLRRNAVRIAEFDKEQMTGVLPIRLLPLGEIG